MKINPLLSSACMQIKKIHFFLGDLSFCSLILPQMGRHHSHCPLRNRRGLQKACKREGAIETLLHDVLWLIEATFNLDWLPQALVWRERERERVRKGRRGEKLRGDDGGGTDGVKRRRATTYNWL